ncbi:hypothetical protein [Micromonospora sp. LOL_021]|uniref:hypothetical protein n=1 Tax=Micromonospora sp. LOL_021 TaxID=3345417 RepID=UPI003A87CAAC
MSSGLLLIDFAGNRAEASFEAWPRALLESAIVERVVGGDIPARLSHYVDGLLERVDRRAPRLIATYCAAAGIGLEVVTAVRRSGEPPPILVMVEPATTTAKDVIREFDQIVVKIGGDRHVPRQIDAAQIRADPVVALDQMSAELRRCVADGLGPIGLSGNAEEERIQREDRTDLVEELVGRYRTWLAYLALTAQASWPAGAPDWDGRVLAVQSATAPAFEWGDGSRVQSQRIATDPRGLLANPELHELVSDLAGLSDST